MERFPNCSSALTLVISKLSIRPAPFGVGTMFNRGIASAFHPRGFCCPSPPGGEAIEAKGTLLLYGLLTPGGLD
mgnify:CR=1 FL=1